MQCGGGKTRHSVTDEWMDSKAAFIRDKKNAKLIKSEKEQEIVPSPTTKVL